jgi:hypothetical protein
VAIYQLNNHSSDHMVTINYPADFKPDGVDVDDLGANKIIRLSSQKGELVYDMNGKLLSEYGGESDFCYSFDKKGNLYRSAQTPERFTLTRKEKHGGWVPIAQSNDQIDVTDEGNIRKVIHGPYNKPATKIVKVTKGGAENVLIDMPGRNLYLGCGNMDSSFIVNEFNQQNHMMKYYEYSNGKLSYLGEVDMNSYPVSDYVIFNNKPMITFYKGKTVYHFENGRLSALKDYSGIPNIHGVSLSNNQAYGYEFKH